MRIWNWWKQKKTGAVDDQSGKMVSKQDDSIQRDFQLADHLVVMRLGSSRHGIYSGNNQVIYYNYYSGLVVEDTIEAFAQGAKIRVIYSPVMYKDSEIVARCRRRVGEMHLQGFSNQSEEFVRWARGGDIW